LFRAYNDWLAETFVQPYPERWKGVAIVNAEDVEGSIAELKRTKALGLSGLMLALEPGDDYPYWDARFDPLWDASVEHEMPIHLHLTTTRKKKDHANTASRIPSPGEMLAGEFGLGIQSVLIDMIHFGVFDRFPELTLVSVESDAGWAAYLMESADYRWKRIDVLRPADQRSKHEPSHYFHENIKLTIMRDRTAILAREIIGIDSLMWGSDFPHQTSTWPNSKAVLDELLHDQPQSVRDALVRDNVRKLYGF
jgi:predicted TIM-barrel fold metal-dependent hydrolase